MRALAALTALAAVVASAGLVVGHGSSATAAVEPCQPGDVAVEIRNFAYSPAAVVVPPGATICWTNRDTAPHTVTSSSAGGFDSGTIGNEQSFRLQFSSEGTFGYLCTFHAYMTGQVVVSANPQPPPPPLPPPPGPPPPAPPPPPQPPTPPAAKALTVSRFGVRVERKSGARWLVVRASPNRAVAGRLSLLRGRRTALRADRRLRAGANVVRVRLPRGLAHGRYLCVLRAGAVRRTASLHL